ncbi:hypothetical protein E4T56_gene12163, partial [Termitomyces sp. T112]
MKFNVFVLAAVLSSVAITFPIMAAPTGSGAGTALVSRKLTWSHGGGGNGGDGGDGGNGGNGGNGGWNHREGGRHEGDHHDNRRGHDHDSDGGGGRDVHLWRRGEGGNGGDGGDGGDGGK